MMGLWRKGFSFSFHIAGTNLQPLSSSIESVFGGMCCTFSLKPSGPGRFRARTSRALAAFFPRPAGPCLILSLNGNILSYFYV